MKLCEPGSTGAALTSVFHQLFVGNSGSGTGIAPPSVASNAAGATAIHTNNPRTRKFMISDYEGVREQIECSDARHGILLFNDDERMDSRQLSVLRRAGRTELRGRRLEPPAVRPGLSGVLSAMAGRAAP